MSAYTSSVALSPRGSEWVLLAPLTWDVGRKGSGFSYVVPAGFVSDLASIPRMARVIFDRGDARLAKAAILHDHMLAAGWSRATAAAEFTEALAADGIGRLSRLVMFLAVTLWRWR